MTVCIAVDLVPTVNLREGSFPVEVLAGGAPDGGLGASPAVTLSSLLVDDVNTGSSAIPGTGLCLSPSSSRGITTVQCGAMTRL